MDDELSQVSIGSVDAPDYLRPTYANYAVVGHTPYDFRLTFAIVKAPRPGLETESAQSSKELHPEAVADMVIPLGMVPGLIQALQTNYSTYLSNYGIPGMEQGPQLEGS